MEVVKEAKPKRMMYNFYIHFLGSSDNKIAEREREVKTSK